MIEEVKQDVKYSSYTPAQKKASQLYRQNNKVKINEQRKKYYQTKKLNDPLLYSYVPMPHISLDQSIMPSVSREVIDKVYIRAKPIVETSSYYINNNFINTLADNPLVNDIYHQKNI